MLPSQPMHIEHYRRIFDQTEQVWEKLVRRVPSAAVGAQALAQQGLITATCNEMRLPDPLTAVKRAMLVLHQALGDQITSRLFKIQTIETVVAVLQLVHRTDDKRMEVIDIQTAVLCAAIERLCRECGGDKPLNVMFHLLNQIPLTHNTHDILVQQITQQFENQPPRVLH